jgi:hypothetical protein
MNLLSKLPISNVIEKDELTDTAWPSESAVQGRAQDWLDNNIFDEEPLFESTPEPDDLN